MSGVRAVLSMFWKADGDPYSLNKEGVTYEEGADGHKPNFEKAFSCYERAAKMDDAYAQYNLGMCYYYGRGCKQNKKMAIELWQKSSAKNHAEAMNNLGACIFNGEATNLPKEYAIELIHKAVMEGCPYAVFNLALCSFSEKDYAKAIELMKQALDKGVFEAAFCLGTMYEGGIGVPKNITEAKKWYEIASEHGNVTAMVNLGVCYLNDTPSNPNKAIELWNDASALGNAGALLNLGIAYLKGEACGVKSDWRKTILYLHKAAKMGHPYAMFCLAECFDNGIGVSCNKKIALGLYQKAASLGDSAAMNALGIRYEYGEEVGKDLIKARQFYIDAAALGNLNAMNNAGLCCVNGVGGPQNRNIAIDLFSRAVDESDSRAMFNLGICYAEEGFEKSKGMELLQHAAKEGNLEALNQLRIYCEDGDISKKKWTEILSQFEKSSFFTIPHALCYAGSCYANGTGVEKDILHAGSLHREAIAMGYYKDGMSKEQKMIELPRPILEVSEDANWFESIKNCGICPWDRSPVQLVSVSKPFTEGDMGFQIVPTNTISFEDSDAKIPVMKEVKATIRLVLSGSQKYSFKILKVIHPKYKFTAHPWEGSLYQRSIPSFLKEQTTFDIELSLTMLCTTSVNIHVPIVFWKGELQDAESIVLRRECNDDDIFVCYLDSKAESDLSTYIDYEDITLFSPAIGSGAVGDVYKGLYRGMDVACKLLKDQESLGSYEIEDFKHEVELLEKFRNPYIVFFNGAVFTRGCLCVVTELCKYGSLSSALKRRPEMRTLRMKLRALLDTSKAMAFLHSYNFFHRDLKPQNVLVSSLEFASPAVCKLSDFGTTKGASTSTLRTSKSTSYTCTYMAPELFKQNEDYETKVDVYSFGIMMASVADNGADPFRNIEARNYMVVAAFIKDGGRPVVDCISVLPPDYVTLMQLCWNEKPELRPAFLEIIPRLEKMLSEFC